MIKIDLITGFLGSGKTTFLKRYARYLMAKGEKIAIIENDYGAINVDMMLLQDVMNEGVTLEMIAGGCDYETHKRRFKTKLIAMGMMGFDRVLIEPSGIYDVDEFFDALYESPLDRWYEIGNVIAIVDARLEDHLSKASDYLLVSQICDAGLVVLSHVQEATKKDIEHTIAHINKAMKMFQCTRQFDQDVLSVDWSKMSEDEYKRIINAGYRVEDHIKMMIDEDNGYSSLYFLNVHLDESQLVKRVQALMKDETCGHIIRVKGFMKKDAGWMEINATHDTTDVHPIDNGQEVIIVIGEDLDQNQIGHYFK
ncbi:MAG: GTP-binding protein [Erysipelotrichaceae bacterium]|nr:GTP-binding protein [Erysipelotrichaceae bacterium]